MKYSISFVLSVAFFSAIAQFNSVDSFKVQELNWPNKDLQNDKIIGTSTDRTYSELLAGKTSSKTIVVAVIDAGVFIDHEDFKGKIWINEDEIAGNGIDDDKNGYVDDVNGWNFLGGSDGRNISYETLELTRIVRDGDKASPDHKRAYAEYKEMRGQHKFTLELFQRMFEVYDELIQTIENESGIRPKNMEELNSVNSSNPKVIEAKETLSKLYQGGTDISAFEEILEHESKYMDYFLNKEFYPREITGDDPLTMDNTTYGNPDVWSTHTSHGTGVAGLIAANRGNNIGIDGIATNVKIMPIRCVPDGDERDKDVALSIRYAVDNGADIINMSFGKAYSPNKNWVDEAVKYAESKDVLLVHAAGNDSKNIDEEFNFPNYEYADGETCKTWVTVGASQSKLNKNLLGTFSNYGATKVTIFAPGVEIVSLDTNSTYSQNSGTSFAAPVYSGVAALVWSYFPDLSAVELIEVLNKTAHIVSKPKKVYQPNSTSEKTPKVKFTTLSQTHGVVNAYNAIKYLQEKK